MDDQTEGNTTDVTIVGGAGRDGFALVLAMADHGLSVNVNDVDIDAIEKLKQGRLPFVEHFATKPLKNALAKKRLIFSTSPDGISPRGPVIVTAGTSADMFLNTDRQLLQDCIDSLLPYMGEPRLLVLRSSVFPGTTDWVDAYVKRHGKNHRIAYCPERAVQGYGLQDIDYYPQIVSGTTPEAESEAIELFQPVVPQLVALSPKEAEFARLFNNAYKYIDFAATNEFYLIAKSAGLDYQRILRGMKHDNPRAQSISNPGFVGGPNLLTDTMQLAAFSGYKFGLTNAALSVNEGLVLQVIQHLQKNFQLQDKTVGLLGMAFKPQSDDTRASLSYKFKKMLSVYAREVLTTDPLVSTDGDLLPLDEVVNRSDLLVLCTPHELYRNVNLQGKPVVDVWGFLDRAISVI